MAENLPGGAVGRRLRSIECRLLGTFRTCRSAERCLLLREHTGASSAVICDTNSSVASVTKSAIRSPFLGIPLSYTSFIAALEVASAMSVSSNFGEGKSDFVGKRFRDPYSRGIISFIAAA